MKANIESNDYKYPSRNISLRSNKLSIISVTGRDTNRFAVSLAGINVTRTPRDRVCERVVTGSDIIYVGS